MTDSQSVDSTQKRIVMCMGPYCNAGKRAAKNAKTLKPLLEAINGEADPPPVTLEFSGCMSMCGAGPNWVIQPEQIICHFVDGEERIRQIVDEHLRD